MKLNSIKVILIKISVIYIIYFQYLLSNNLNLTEILLIYLCVCTIYILILGLLFNYNKYIHIAHLMYQIIIFIISFFIYNNNLILLNLSILFLTIYLRFKYNKCPFRFFHSNKDFLFSNSINFQIEYLVLVLIIINLIKLCINSTLYKYMVLVY